MSCSSKRHKPCKIIPFGALGEQVIESNTWTRLNRNSVAFVLIYVHERIVTRVDRVKVSSIVLLTVMFGASAAAADLEQARKLYNLTQFEQSLKVLQAIPVKDGPVHELIGRNYYMEGEYKKATESLEKAALADPASSEIALWAGRAF